MGALPQLKHAIMHDELENFYIFIGVETEVQRVYIDKISGVNKKPINHVDKVLDIYGKSNNLFMVQNYTYVCIEDRDFIANEHAWETIEKVIGNNTLILWYTNIDKRSKFYKRFSDKVYDFEHMEADILRRYIKKAIPLSDANCDLLMDYCEYDYSRCLLEIDKINQYIHRLGGTEQSIDGIFIDLIDQGVVYKPIGDVIFDLSNAVINRKCRTVLNRLHDYELSDGVPLKAISVIYGAFKKLLQVQSCKYTDINDIANDTGLSSKEVYQISNYTSKYRIGELVYAMRFIQRAETDFKQGLIDEEYLLPYVIVNVL